METNTATGPMDRALKELGISTLTINGHEATLYSAGFARIGGQRISVICASLFGMPIVVERQERNTKAGILSRDLYYLDVARMPVLTNWSKHRENFRNQVWKDPALFAAAIAKLADMPNS